MRPYHYDWFQSCHDIFIRLTMNKQNPLITHRSRSSVSSHRASVVRVSHQWRRGHGFDSCSSIMYSKCAKWPIHLSPGVSVVEFVFISPCKVFWEFILDFFICHSLAVTLQTTRQECNQSILSLGHHVSRASANTWDFMINMLYFIIDYLVYYISSSCVTLHNYILYRS